MELKTVPNFTLVPFTESCVNVYGKDCLGAKAAKADVMLTFGSTIAPMDGNNTVLSTLYPTHIDVFLTENQAQGLLEQLKVMLEK